eukprot:750817-Rhodomonas_salina.1
MQMQRCPQRRRCCHASGYAAICRGNAAIVGSMIPFTSAMLPFMAAVLLFKAVALTCMAAVQLKSAHDARFAELRHRCACLSAYARAMRCFVLAVPRILPLPTTSVL